MVVTHRVRVFNLRPSRELGYSVGGGLEDYCVNGGTAPKFCMFHRLSWLPLPLWNIQNLGAVPPYASG